MTRETVDPALAQLQSDLLELGEMVQAALYESIGILRYPTVGRYRRLVQRHHEVERKRAEVEAGGLLLLCNRKVSSNDTCTLAAVLEIAAELERITYLAREIAHTPLQGSARFASETSESLAKMIDKSSAMLQHALRALASAGDSPRRAGISANERIHLLYGQLNDLVEHSTDLKPSELRHLVRIVQGQRQLADRVANVFEWIAFCKADGHNQNL